jgi:hypothetical protein
MAVLQWAWFALFAAWAGLVPLRRARLVRGLVTRLRRR